MSRKRRKNGRTKPPRSTAVAPLEKTQVVSRSSRHLSQPTVLFALVVALAALILLTQHYVDTRVGILFTESTRSGGQAEVTFGSSCDTEMRFYNDPGPDPGGVSGLTGYCSTWRRHPVEFLQDAAAVFLGVLIGGAIRSLGYVQRKHYETRITVLVGVALMVVASRKSVVVEQFLIVGPDDEWVDVAQNSSSFFALFGEWLYLTGAALLLGLVALRFEKRFLRAGVASYG